MSHIFVWLLSSPLPRSHFLLWPTARARTPLVGCCSCFRPEWSRNTHVETKTKKLKAFLSLKTQTKLENESSKKKKLCKIFQTRHGAQRFHSRFPNVKKNRSNIAARFPSFAHTRLLFAGIVLTFPRGGLLSTMHVRLLDRSERILLDGVFSDSKQDIVI